MVELRSTEHLTVIVRKHPKNKADFSILRSRPFALV